MGSTGRAGTQVHCEGGSLQQDSKNSEDNSESFLRAALNLTLMRHNADTLIRHIAQGSVLISPQVDGPVLKPELGPAVLIYICSLLIIICIFI